jgi:hypothetical protein
LARWTNRRRIHPPTGLSSGGGVVSSCCSGGGVGVVLSFGGGGGGGHTPDPVTGGPWSASLAPDLGARVPVCLPSTPTWILVVRLGAILSGESSTGLTSTGSSSSCSSATVTPSPPSLELGNESSVCLVATG